VSDTSLSLLQRLRQTSAPADWERLVGIYRPLIQGWLLRHGLSSADSDDLTQEVFAIVVRQLPGFDHSSQPGAFRCWLRNVTVNRLRAFWRKRQGERPAAGGSDAGELLAQLEDPGSGPSRLWDQEHDRHVMARLLEIIEAEFNPTDWRAFRRYVLDGEPAAAVAAELGVSVNVVLLAKSRILRRLRQEAQGFLD
jgi:RNA polymerase sigma-70 factor (ECF subfamily)